MIAKLGGAAALVTGASSGYGDAIARALAQQGADVALVARRKDRLDQLAQEINDSGGGRALPITADITDQQQAIAAVDQAAENFGRLDIVVNNAGLMLIGPAADAPTEEWDRMLSVNLAGLLYVTHAALPHLRDAAQTSPRSVSDVVNVASTLGRKGVPGAAVYNMTKFGVVGFTDTLRQEHASEHVRISVVLPGAGATELTTHNRPEVMPAGDPFEGAEILEPEDVAGAVTFIVTQHRRIAVSELTIRATEELKF
jgi:NADP-dependent 3-hydroxy acid dehydrogenase YdfG